MKDASLNVAAPSASSEAPLWDAAALAGRILLAAIFFISGLEKVAAPAATMEAIAAAGLPLPQVALLVAVLVEIVGSVLLVLGLRLRPAAAALAVFTVAAAISFHGQLSDQNQFIHFMKNLALAGGLLQVVAFGGGRYALDRIA